MSQLSPFVRFSRSAANALMSQAKDAEATGDKLKEDERLTSAMVEYEASVLLYRLAGAFGNVAVDLEQQIAADLSRVGRVEHIPSRSESTLDLDDTLRETIEKGSLHDVTVKPFKVEFDVDPEQGSPQPGADA